MPEAATPEMRALVEQQVEEILAAKSYGSVPFTREMRDQLDSVSASVGSFLSGTATVASGPQWLSGASIVNGTITAEKITVNTLEAIVANTGTLNVTGDITAAAAFPATGARIVINSSGLWGYSGAATTTFKLNTDGSGEIGGGANKISWTTGGVVTVPSAVIGSLTIADVGSGNLGGSYATGSSNPKITFSSTGIVATNSGGTTTFQLNATTGAVTATGSYTVKSAASGARVEISSSGGIEGFNSSSVSTFLLNAATGAARIGSVSGGFSVSSAGDVSISGSLLVGGTINASSVTVTNLVASNITSGSLGSGSSGINLGGTNGLGINGSLTLGSGGSIVDADGSSWTQSGITLVSAGAFGDTIKWRVSGVDVASIYANSTDAYFQYKTKGMVFVFDDGVVLQNGAGTNSFTINSATGGIFGHSTSNVSFALGDAAGSDLFVVQDSGLNIVFGVNSNGDLVRPIANDSTALGAYFGRVPIFINGSLKYLAVYS